MTVYDSEPNKNQNICHEDPDCHVTQKVTWSKKSRNRNHDSYVQISDKKHVISRIIIQICFMLIFTVFIHLQSFVCLTYSQSYSIRLSKGTIKVNAGTITFEIISFVVPTLIGKSWKTHPNIFTKLQLFGWWLGPISGKLIQPLTKYGRLFLKSVRPPEKLKFWKNIWMAFPRFANKGWTWPFHKETPPLIHKDTIP